MAMQAPEGSAIPPEEAPAEEPSSARQLAWETLRERDLEEKMGQGGAHARAVELVVAVITALRNEQKREAYVGWDVFVEWDPNDPRARVSPDLFLLDGQSPDIVPSIWRTWEPGCDPPRFAMEIVSKKSRTKDYDQSPPRYSALGTEELAIFDPEPRGEEAFALQVYRRSPRGQFLRVYAGPGPAESKVLGAWLVVVDGGTHVRLARSALGTDLVLTAEERATLAEEQLAESRDQLAESRDQLAESQEQLAAARDRVGELEALLATQR
jgi:Uma2 family endonuclease